jgi:Flp pilus assembly protein TadD
MRKNRLYLIILFLLGLVLYANTLSHSYVLDDFSVIKENSVVKQGVDGIATIWKTHYRFGYGYQQANLYRPLTLTIFAIQWEIAPDNPAFAHFFNVLLFAALGVIIFLFLQAVLGKKWQALSFFASALFICHPIHTEVVANIKSLDDILAMGLSLIGIMQLLRFEENAQKKHLLYSLLLFTAAFFCKESTVTFLALIPLILLLFRSQSIGKALRSSTWYLIPFAIYMLVRIKVLGSLGGDKTIAQLDNLLMAAPDAATRLATAIKIMGLYFWKLVYPHPLMNDYSLKQISLVGFDNTWVWLSLLLYGSLIASAWLCRKKQVIITFSIAFFLITMSLYSNLFFTIGTSFGERLLFIPSLGFCLLLAYLIYLPFSSSLQGNNWLKKASVPLILVSCLSVLYAFKTIDRNKAWKDNFTLYSTDVKNCDKSARCHYYHGLGLMKEKAITLPQGAARNKLLQEAAAAFDRAITILPKYSDAWGQKGLAYYRLGNYPKAEEAYLKAAEYNPSNATALSNLGSLYFQQQRYTEAKTTFEKALQSNPRHVDALSNYAATLGTLGDYAQAIVYFKRAIEVNPGEANYYQMVGVTYQNMGKQQEANFYLQKAQQLRNSRP